MMTFHGLFGEGNLGLGDEHGATEVEGCGREGADCES